MEELVKKTKQDDKAEVKQPKQHYFKNRITASHHAHFDRVSTAASQRQSVLRRKKDVIERLDDTIAYAMTTELNYLSRN
jgi:lipid II:glycine glycyltransferase (peptidoglycan interpeptide bridge formation enzyme)